MTLAGLPDTWAWLPVVGVVVGVGDLSSLPGVCVCVYVCMDLYDWQIL